MEPFLLSLYSYRIELYALVRIFKKGKSEGAVTRIRRMEKD